MSGETVKALHRLKRRLGKERARYERWAADAANGSAHKDRCWYEANMLSLAMGFVDDEIRKAKGKA